MRVVVDASVAVKWVFPDPAVEPPTDRAVALLERIRNRDVGVIQPPHWLFEVVAVVVRLSPPVAVPAIALLDALELTTCDDVTVLRRAAELAAELRHHLFDTLYHAVALEQDATLVTADVRYANKAREVGGLCLLRDFAPTAGAG